MDQDLDLDRSLTIWKIENWEGFKTETDILKAASGCNDYSNSQMSQTFNLLEFCYINQCPARRRGLLDGGEDGVESWAIAISHHSPPAGQGRAPEGKAPIVVDGVVGLGHQQEVCDGGVGGAQHPGEDDPRMTDVLPTPGQVITGYQEHRVRVEAQELPDAVEEEGATHLVPLVPLLHKADVVSSPDMDIDKRDIPPSLLTDDP